MAAAAAVGAVDAVGVPLVVVEEPSSLLMLLLDEADFGKDEDIGEWRLSWSGRSLNPPAPLLEDVDVLLVRAGAVSCCFL